MKNIKTIEIKENTYEELLPGYTSTFPYIASRAELNKYAVPYVPWHWHKPVELFYIKNGCVEYTTPNGHYTFPKGSGGLINSNILHSSKILSAAENNVELLHIFDPSFLSGEPGNLMERKYILPLTTAPELEIIALNPENSKHQLVLSMIWQSFEIPDDEWGYEFRLRESLTHIWLELLKLIDADSKLTNSQRKQPSDDKIKSIMIYIHEHFQEDISVDQIADACHISRRTCFRLFQEKLHISPLEYICDYRLQQARRLLLNTDESITFIAQNCGFRSSSYFGKLFREHFGCTPNAFRRKMAQF